LIIRNGFFGLQQGRIFKRGALGEIIWKALSSTFFI